MRLRKSCGHGTPDWRVIPAGREGCRKEISSERIGAPDMVDCLGGALGTVDSLGGAAGKALSSFFERLVLTVVIPPSRSVGTDLSAVITWVGLGLSAAEPHAL